MTDAHAAPQATAQNFNPASLAARVEEGLSNIEAFAKRAEEIEAAIEGFVNTLAPIVQILAPFLPSPIGTALQELPEIEAEILKLKSFIATDYAQLQSLLGNAGTGAAQTGGVTLPAGEITAAEMPAQSVGNFSAPAMPSTPPPPGMEWRLINGGWALSQIPPTL